MKLTIHDDPEQLEQRIRALQKLKTMKVKVGLPASAGDRLRFILAVQEHGSPMMRIPSRPVIRPALAKPETRSRQPGTGKIPARRWRLPDRPARTGSGRTSIPESRLPTAR